MLNKKAMALIIFFVSLLVVSAVSAADNVTEDVVSADITDEVVSVEETTEETIKFENNQVILEDNEGNESTGNFNELDTLIQNTSYGQTLKLEKNYKYDSNSNGAISINKAITIDGDNHEIDADEFSQIFSISNVVLKNIKFLNGVSDNEGGAVSVGSNCYLINCTFINNSAPYAGALNFLGVNNQVINCTFINNIGYSYEGAIRITLGSNYNDIINSTFIGNTAGSIGALSCHANNCNLINCTFIKNVATGYSSAIACWGSNVNIENCKFINHTSATQTILWDDQASSGKIVNSTFINNSNQYCVQWDGLRGTITDSTFVNNKKAILWNGKKGTMSNNYFDPSYNSITSNTDDLIIIKKDTKMECDNVSFNYMDNNNFTLYLKDLEDNNLSNKKIKFIRTNDGGNSIFYSTTDYNGVATLPIELTKLVGNFTIDIIFDGDDNYNSCNTSFILKIFPSNSSLSIENVNSSVGHYTTLVVIVNSTSIVNEGIVTFFDDKTKIGESRVSNNVATLSYTPSAAGEHAITAIFNSTNYLSSNSTAKLLVDSATVKVLVDQGIVGFNSTFVAEVNGLYSTINEGNVRFYVDNKLIGTVPVVNGSANINYMPLTAKTYTVKVVFCDSDKFLNDENSTSFTVVPADSSIAIDDMNGTVGHNLVITVNITSSNNLTINEGYVIFFDGSAQIGESNVHNGVATLTYTPTTAGEHAITTMFYSTNYGDPINSALLNVSKAEIDLNIGYIDTVYFSNPSNFAVNVLSNSKGVNEGNIKYYANGKYIGMSNVYDGQSSLSYVTNTTGSFKLLVVYNETDNYFAKNASTTFYVNQMPTTLTGESVIFDEQQYKTFTTELKDNNANGVYNQTVRIELIKYSGESATFTGVSDGNGITFYDVGTLAGGMWYVAGTYNGNENYIGSNFADKFIVVRLDTTTEIEEIQNAQVNHNYKLKANIHDENGKLVKEGILQFYLDGVDIGSIDLSNNQGHQSALGNGVLGAVNPMFEYELGADASELYLNYVPTKAGKHTLTAVYEGTTIYKASNSTTTFEVADSNTKGTEIDAADVSTVYNGGKYILITLKDANGNAISGVKVTVKFSNGKTVTSSATDKNGQVKVSTNGLAPVKTYKATITFAGNSKYDKSTKTVNVKVTKATPKLTAKAKTFKKSVKTKKYTITLKTNQNKVMKSTKVTLKINKKTYTAKTNSKGKATFKITNLKKKGTFKATVTYKGNKYYNKVTKKVKITVK